MYDTRTALIEVEPGRAGRRRAWLRRGKAGNVETLFEMVRIIRAALGLDGARENTELAALADSILDEWNVRTGSEYEINRAVFEWIAENISYTQDRAGGYERLQYPSETYRRKRGDCDDLEILATTLLALCGIQSLWLEAAKYSEATDGEDHVYGYAVVRPEYSLDSSGIIYHDLTGAITEGRALGWHETDFLEWIRVPVFEDPRNTMFSGLTDTVIGAGIASIGPVLNYLAAGKQASGGGKQPSDKEKGAAFESAAVATVQLFNRIQHQAAITADDYNAAAAALSALSGFAAEFPTEYITKQWNDSSYKPAFEQRLQQIRTAAVASGTTATTGATDGGGDATSTASVGGINLGLLALVAAGLVGYSLLRSN